MFQLSDGDKAGVAIGGVFAFLITIGLSVARYTGIEAVSPRKYKLASRLLLAVWSIVVLGLVRSDDVSAPCFFGLQTSVDAAGITNSGDEAACDFAIATSSVSIVAAVLSLLLALLLADDDDRNVLLIADLLLQYTLGLVWLALGIYLAVQLQNRQDRCNGDGCENSKAFSRAVEATVFAFVAATTSLLGLSDAYGTINLPHRAPKTPGSHVLAVARATGGLIFSSIVCLFVGCWSCPSPPT